MREGPSTPCIHSSLLQDNKDSISHIWLLPWSKHYCLMEKLWTNAGKNNLEFNYWSTIKSFFPPQASCLSLEALQHHKQTKEKGTRFKKLPCHWVIPNPLNWVPWASTFAITISKSTQGNTEAQLSISQWATLKSSRNDFSSTYDNTSVN